MPQSLMPSQQTETVVSHLVAVGVARFVDVVIFLVGVTGGLTVLTVVVVFLVAV